MIELGTLMRLVHFMSLATRVVHAVRALPGAAGALVLVRVAHGHTRHSARAL